MTPRASVGDSPAGALERLRELRCSGRASPKQFHLLTDALVEVSGKPGPLAGEVMRSPDLHVAFRLDSGEPLTCVRLRRGRLSSHPDPESSATQVTLPAATAARALKDHPARVLGEAYMSGEANVKGEVSHLMTLVALLESLAPRLAPEDG